MYPSKQLRTELKQGGRSDARWGGTALELRFKAARSMIGMDLTALHTAALAIQSKPEWTNGSARGSTWMPELGTWHRRPSRLRRSNGAALGAGLQLGSGTALGQCIQPGRNLGGEGSVELFLQETVDFHRGTCLIVANLGRAAGSYDMAMRPCVFLILLLVATALSVLGAGR